MIRVYDSAWLVSTTIKVAHQKMLTRLLLHSPPAATPGPNYPILMAQLPHPLISTSDTQCRVHLYNSPALPPQAKHVIMST